MASNFDNSEQDGIETLPFPPSTRPPRHMVLQMFRRVRQEFPSAFLFETADPHTRLVKRSVIGLRPKQTLRRRFDLDSRSDLTELIVGGQVRELPQTFFTALTDLQNGLRSKAIEADLGIGRTRAGGLKRVVEQEAIPYRFGGIFGSIGYESAQELESRVVSNSSLDGNLTSAEVFVADQLIVLDHSTRKVYLIGALAAEVYRAAIAGNLIANVASPILSPTLRVVPLTEQLEIAPERVRAFLGQAEFCVHAKSLQEHIRAGNIFQAVLAERFTIATKASAIAIFERLCEINPAPFHFFFPLSDGEFAGTSPESLVNVKAQVAVTHPIAGTKPRGHDEDEDRRLAQSLRRSRKEAAEHLMLVDLARNDLGRVAVPGTVKVTKFRELHRFATVMHLVSEVKAQLPTSLDAMDAFRACFPAGTLTGAPKIRAMQILSQLESSRRGAYGGAVIALDPVTGELESCIAIRCFKKLGHEVTLQAGAGVVADSKPLLEYAEILHKLRALRQAIFAAEKALRSPRISGAKLSGSLVRCEELRVTQAGAAVGAAVGESALTILPIRGTGGGS